MFEFTYNQVMSHQFIYTIDEINQVLNDHLVAFSIAGIMVYLIGFLQYFTALYIQKKEKASPWFLFMHAYYIGHDLTFVLSYKLWFQELDFWLFKVLWAGCIAFCFIELWALYMTVKSERQEVFGKYYGGKEVTESQAWVRGILAYLLGIAIFYLLRIGIGDTCCLFLMMTTNWIVAVFPQFLVQERPERSTATLMLGIFVIAGTIFTFAPQGIGFWATASAAFRGPWYTIAGIIALGVSIYNVVLIARKPKKAKALKS